MREELPDLAGHKVRVMGQGGGTVLQVSTWDAVNPEADLNSVCYLVESEEWPGGHWISRVFVKMKGKRERLAPFPRS